MTKYIVIITMLLSTIAHSQNTFTTVIKDSTTNELLSGVTANVKGTVKYGRADNEGRVTVKNIPDGKQIIVFSYVGYIKLEREFTFPLVQPIEFVFMESANKETQAVVVVGTRSNRSIAKIPTRVEVLTEEIDEAATMDPSKIAHLLTHSTGIQVQQTSATSNTANVRIQGLDGRYTQILKDGFPLYGGFSGSLSIMQIPPLDLRQIEYIKGGASTLYGGGAISGLIKGGFKFGMNLAIQSVKEELKLTSAQLARMSKIKEIVHHLVSRKTLKATGDVLTSHETALRESLQGLTKHKDALMRSLDNPTLNNTTKNSIQESINVANNTISQIQTKLLELTKN